MRFARFLTVLGLAAVLIAAPLAALPDVQQGPINAARASLQKGDGIAAEDRDRRGQHRQRGHQSPLP
jgi:hypothetical protein